MIGQLVVTLLNLGFKPELRPRGYDSVFNYGPFNVSIDQDRDGVWVFLDDGKHKIKRQFLKTEDEVKELASRLQKSVA